MACKELALRRFSLQAKQQQHQGSDTADDTAREVSGSQPSGRAAAAKARRFSPYGVHAASKSPAVGSLSCSHSQQSTQLPRQQQQQQQEDEPTAATGSAALQQTIQQSPDALLDIAISLASRSLSRTVAAFQAACHCWAAGADAALTNHALEVAEAAMARTIRRMELAQQLAAAVFRQGPAGPAGLQPVQCLQQQQLEQLTGLMAALQQNRQQQLLAALPAAEEEDGEEEVCSSWAPCGATGAVQN